MTGSAGLDAEWWRGGARRFGDGVRRRYDSPESFSAGGEEALGAGDVAAALCFFGGAVGLLHTHYVVRQFAHRESAAADAAVLYGLLSAMSMAVRERSAAVGREFAESITEQLVDVARACAANGFDGGRYVAAAETLGNLVGADGSRLAQAAQVPSCPDASGAVPTAAAIAAEWALHDHATAVARWHEGYRRYDDAPLDSQAELTRLSYLRLPRRREVRSDTTRSS